MVNPLTGDFDASLQVDGSTLDRLLATLHQNGVDAGGRPSLPHRVQLWLGAPAPVDGVRGRVQAQVAVPRLQLLHGATDRFRLAFGVRAWFRPDHGSTPFPAFVHGTVTADFRLVDIDPACPGWRRRAAEHLWVQVDPASVRFEGSARDDAGLQVLVRPGVKPPDPTVIDRVTRQIAALLITRVVATPHPVRPGFRKGQLRSLVSPAGSAVVLPLLLGGAAPPGAASPGDQVLLAGHDLAVAVRVEVVLGAAQPALDAIAALNLTVPVHVETPPWAPVPDIDTVYRVTVSPPGLSWLPQGTHAVLRVTVSGQARTQSVLSDARFDIRQDVVLSYDGSAGRLRLTPGSNAITVRASGLGSGIVATHVRQAIEGLLPGLVNQACATAQPTLDGMTDRLNELSAQLRTLDAQASASLEAAEFLPAGLVMRGRVRLSPRLPAVVAAAKTPEQDAHSALDSWLPGGRIDRYEWQWRWFHGGTPGKASLADRFLLQRREQLAFSGFGAASGRAQLPGLDGWGEVCLVVSGAQVDAVSGRWVPVRSVQRCRRFGMPLAGTLSGLRLRDFGALVGQAAAADAHGGARADRMLERPLLRPAASSAAAAPNTLLVHVGAACPASLPRLLRRALADCGRGDAALALLVLYDDGARRADDARTARALESVARGRGVPLMVSEDVDGGWSRAMAIGRDRQAAGSDGAPAWRLLHPDGRVAWHHEGWPEAKVLTLALLQRLQPTPGWTMDEQPHGPPIGTRISGHLFSTASLGAAIAGRLPQPPRCPPLPLVRQQVGTSVVFAGSRSAGLTSMLSAWADAQRADPLGTDTLVLVIDDTDAGAVERLRADVQSLGLDAQVLVDADGRVAERLAVQAWPSALHLDAGGRLREVRLGAAALVPPPAVGPRDPDDRGTDAGTPA